MSDRYKIQKNDTNKDTIIFLNPDIKECPKCKILIQKGEGCSLIYCKICKFRFDFDTMEEFRIPMVPNRTYLRVILLLVLVIGFVETFWTFCWSTEFNSN